MNARHRFAGLAHLADQGSALPLRRDEVRAALDEIDLLRGLAYVQSRIIEWTADTNRANSVAQYQACANEVLALLDIPGTPPDRSAS